MAMETLGLLVAGVFVIALLYSSVGHAGASGYIAVMSLLSLAPAEIKPIALALNILVASIGSWQFWRAGHFSWSLFWPFALLSVPFAFLGGYLNLPTQAFKIVVGIVLLISAAQFLLRPPAEGESHPPAKPLAMGVGAGLGLLSGLTGTGGGIFLTPLLIFLRWARTKTASATSALFILLNSISGLLGNFSATQAFPKFGVSLLVAAGLGGAIGSWCGSRRLAPLVIKRLLAVVLIIAGMKLVFT
ncbi:MAG TPA: sulfite exporter TauE/SafE family protein [Steroidobacteraceae bacterium]|nr:sulfite exporter TauE/SafE family protein [Steroidobacteraceae bacterium]